MIYLNFTEYSSSTVTISLIFHSLASEFGILVFNRILPRFVVVQYLPAEYVEYVADIGALLGTDLQKTHPELPSQPLPVLFFDLPALLIITLIPD